MASIIINFANILGVKVLTINPVPSSKDIETPLEVDIKPEDNENLSKTNPEILVTSKDSENEVKNNLKLIKRI